MPGEHGESSPEAYHNAGEARFCSKSQMSWRSMLP